MMSTAFIAMDAIPRSMKNFFVAFYGTFFGTFLGIIFATPSMLVLIIALIAEDFLLTRFSPVAKETKMLDSIGSDPFDYTRIQTEQVAVGVGDFIAFSLISVHSLLFFPVYVWFLSTILAFLGIFINVVLIAEEGKPLPGIPLPGLLAVFPWVVHIIALIMIAG